MAKRAVSRDAFRGLFAFYAAKAHRDHNAEGEEQLLRLFGSAKDIPDGLLQKWSETAALRGSEAIGSVMEPLARGTARYDHASDFLHALLRELDRKMH
jgi:hypothetical protein